MIIELNVYRKIEGYLGASTKPASIDKVHEENKASHPARSVHSLLRIPCIQVALLLL